MSTTRSASSRRLSTQEADEVFTQLQSLWPDAKCELVHHSPFQLLLAVVLSAQTTDKAVNKALEPLFLAQPEFSPRDLVAMGEKRFLSVIKSIGLAPTKAKNSVALSKQLLAKHKGEVPMDRQALEELPGVGRKTANVVLNVVGQLPTMAVDTHVARVSVRLGLARPTENRLQIEEDLLQIIPARWGLQAHHLLIFHGRYHCMARQPKCETCPVLKLCKKQGVESGSKKRATASKH
ncbi:MAG: hypothetical protein RIR26_415 [Pseudomonadota bacterium]